MVAVGFFLAPVIRPVYLLRISLFQISADVKGFQAVMLGNGDGDDVDGVSDSTIGARLAIEREIQHTRMSQATKIMTRVLGVRRAIGAKPGLEDGRII